MPEAPFLSTAILSAYLKAHSLNVIQRDLNVEFWLHFEEDAQIRDIYQRSQQRWQNLSSQESLERHERVLLAQLASISKLPEERFVLEVQRGIISRDAFRALIQEVSEFRVDPQQAERRQVRGGEETQNYHDLLYSDISHSLYASSTEDLCAIISDDANPFRPYFQRTFIPEFKMLVPSIVGISIAAINQVVPAFTLAALVKDHRPETHVVIGGSWCTQVHESLAPKLPLFAFIDSMAIYEGEEPLLELCRTLQRGESPKDIPNLYLQHAGLVSAPRRRFAMDMNRLPTPDFEGLPLSGYNFPRTLTLQSSRGCYWGKCTFCSYPLLEPAYKARKSEKLIGDIQKLKDLYGIEDVGFTDALLSPSFCRRFSGALLQYDIKIRWAMFARFEKQFTPDLLEQMAQSGCSMVSWGLESGNEEILRIIEKSISLTHAERILAAGAVHGIHNRVLVMYGHPTETFPQSLETVGFLRRNFENIHSIAYNYYHPEMGTPIDDVALKLDIRLERDNKRDLAFGYQWESSLNEGEKLQIKSLFDGLSQQLAARNDTREAYLSAIRSPQKLFDGEGSFTVSIPGEDGRTTLLSTIVERGGHKRRESFIVRDI